MSGESWGGRGVSWFANPALIRFKSSRLDLGQKRTTNKLAAAKAPPTPAQTSQRRGRSWERRTADGAEAGMAANSRASKSLGTGGGGRARSRASKDSADRSSFGCMGNLVNQEISDALKRFGGAPFHGAAGFIEH